MFSILKVNTYYFTLIAGLNTKIEVDAIWAEYLIKHREILK